MVYTPTSPFPAQPVTSAPAKSSFKAPFKDSWAGMPWALGLPQRMGAKAFKAKMVALKHGEQYTSELWHEPETQLFLVDRNYQMLPGQKGSGAEKEHVACLVYFGMVHNHYHPEGQLRRIHYNYPITSDNRTGLPGFVVQDHHIALGKYWSSPFKQDFTVSHVQKASKLFCRNDC